MDLKTLTELRAPSGHEQPIRRALLAELKDMGLDPQLDRMGNVVVVKQGTKGADAPRVMVAAHMDEVGLLVANATEEGFLRTLPVGGVDSRVVISKRVLCGDEAIPGVIGAMAIHLQTAEDRKHVLSYDDIYVDIGAKDKAEAEAKCPKGTYITFDTDYVEFGEGCVSAKALDDRVGCYNLLRVLKEEYPWRSAAAARRALPLRRSRIWALCWRVPPATIWAMCRSLSRSARSVRVLRYRLWIAAPSAIGACSKRRCGWARSRGSPVKLRVRSAAATTRGRFSWPGRVCLRWYCRCPAGRSTARPPCAS